MNKKPVIFIAVSAAAAIAYAGWQYVNESSAPPRSISRSEETIRLDQPMSTTKATEKYKVGVLFASLDSQFALDEAYGIFNEAKKAGVKIIWRDANGKPDLQQQQLQEFVDNKVDAILLAPLTYDVRSIVEPARMLGVPVFTHIYETQPAAVISSVRNEEREIGKAQAVALGEKLAGTGTVALLMGPQTAYWAGQRADGFITALKEDFPNIKIVVERSLPTTKTAGFDTAKDLLPAFPEISAFYTVSDSVAQGVSDAILEANRQDQVVVVTADFSRDLLPYVTDGRITSVVDTGGVSMGRTVLNLAVQALNGERVPTQIITPTSTINTESAKTASTEERWAPVNWKPN